MSHRETRPFWRRLAATTLVVLPVLLVCLPALADSRQTKDKERIARKACLDGDYKKGVAILSDLFLSSMDATYIFNQGRCYEQNGQYESAIARFEEYLRSNLTPETRASSEKHLEDCRKNLAKERESSAPPAALAPLPVAPAPATRTEPEPRPDPNSETSSLASTETVPPPVPPSERRWGLITGGIVTASLGAGIVVGGLLFHMQANSMASDWENKPGSYSASEEDKQKTYRTLAGVSYGVGAAMVATGTILIIVGAKPRAPSSNNLAIAPTFGPGLAGAVLTGAF
jgi:tetratricopeptide (TPR) repeat protein